MDAERRKTWDERYARREHTYDFRPSSPLAEAIENVPPGVALDLACGSGRHAIHLAERGWRVVAVDGSPVGIQVLLDEAARRGVADRIETRVADLEGTAPEYRIPEGAFDLVCDFYFLARERFPELAAAVRPGGRFAAAIHVDDGRPGRFLLAPGELETIVRGWGFEVLISRQGASGEPGHHHATAEIVARRPLAGPP
jgi:SAM-dependent methyltransferase